MNIEEMKNTPQWVVWLKSYRAGEWTKIPHQKTGELASSTDPETWTTYEEAVKVADRFSGIGFVLTKESRFVFVDLDHCLDKDGEIQRSDFKELFKKANTYTEISPSGDGLHLFFKTKEPVDLEANRSSKCPNFEIYNHGRYATFTENIYKKKSKIREITEEELNQLLSSTGYPWRQKEEATEQKQTTLSDDEIKKRMFAAKSGDRIQKLWEGDTSLYGDDDSAADMALCAHLAFWCGKDADCMERLWLSSPLGNRKKTKTREDYRKRTIEKAIANVSESYSGPEKDDETPGVMTVQGGKHKGKPIVNLPSVKALIEADPVLSSSFRFNEFTQTLETNFESPVWTPMEERHDIAVAGYLQKMYTGFENVAVTKVRQALMWYAHKNKHHALKNYFQSLEWDGEHRLNSWLSRVYGTPDDEYHNAVGANWLKALIKRVMQPGCQFDHVLVLWGAQGLKKTTSLYTLGAMADGEYHAETTINVTNKDFYLLLLKNVIVEFSEGETLTRSETKALKSVITTRIDNVRLPYGRQTESFPRHCVFAMTTNDSQFLKDDTGNRRWLPVEVTMLADIEWLEENKEQLFAEAYFRVMEKGESIHEFPEEEMIAKQQERLAEDPYSTMVVEWFLGLTDIERENGVTALDAYQAVYQQNAPLGREMPRGVAMVIASYFRNYLHLEKSRTMYGGVRSHRWFPSEETRKLIANKEKIITEFNEEF